MKSFSAVLCILSLAWITAWASGGRIGYCIGSNEERQNCASSDSQETCCPFEGVRSANENPIPLGCRNCIDIEINAGELDLTTPSFERVVIKAPLALAIFDRVESPAFKLLPARPPPVEQRASEQYAGSVQFRC